MNESCHSSTTKLFSPTGGIRGLSSRTFSRSHQSSWSIYKYCCSKTSFFSQNVLPITLYYSPLFLLLKFSLIAATFFLHWTTVLPGTAAATRSHLWLASLGKAFKA
uniref:Zuotin, putative n=1 Tax=Arundo donax TaxID=35708 RepID=A0A0A9CVV9_ARUDO